MQYCVVSRGDIIFKLGSFMQRLFQRLGFFSVHFVLVVFSSDFFSAVSAKQPYYLPQRKLVNLFLCVAVKIF